MVLGKIGQPHEHAIIELTDKISKAIDDGKYTIGIFR